MTILEQIQNNDIVDLHISAPADDVFDSIMVFLDALEKNTSIESIKFQEDFIGDLRNDNRAQLLYAMGQVKNLKEVTIADGLLQVNDVTTMIQNATSLRVLRLRSLVLQGVQSDFDGCESSLYQHPCLKEFEMDGCSPAIAEISIEKLTNAGKKVSAGQPLTNPATMNTKTALSA